VPDDEPSPAKFLHCFAPQAAKQGVEEFLVLKQALFELAVIRVRDLIQQFSVARHN
jgi:hypothetical protein